MACGPLVFTKPIPAGSRVCGKVTASGDDFMARVVIMDSDGGGTIFGTSALLNGPVCFAMDDRGYNATIQVTIGEEAPTVTLELFIDSADDERLFQCDWTFSTPGPTVTVNVVIIPA